MQEAHTAMDSDSPIETSFCSAQSASEQLFVPFSSATARPCVPDAAMCAEVAAQLVSSSSTMSGITESDAAVLLNYLHPFVMESGEVFMREGGMGYNDHALLIVRGHVLLESMLGEEGESIPVSVLGPGRWVGEIARKDRVVMRQVSCRVADDAELLCGVLTRKQLFMLMTERPNLAAKLMLSMGYSSSLLLRELHQKMVCFIQINNMHQLNRAMDFAQLARKMLKSRHMPIGEASSPAEQPEPPTAEETASEQMASSASIGAGQTSWATSLHTGEQPAAPLQTVHIDTAIGVSHNTRID